MNSGDLGRLDAEGYLWITGRAKDLIIRGGHNIDPMAIEEVFYQHPAVGLAAVVGQPDVYAGELPVAYVQLKPARRWSRRSGRVDPPRTPERAAVPVDVYFVDAMPLTAVGKVFKPALRWDAAQRVFAQVLAPLAEGGVEVTVRVAAHPTHGSLATVSIRGAAPGAQGASRAAGRERLAPFVMRHEIVWI